MNNTEFNNLLPHELESIKQVINELILDLSGQSLTNKKYLQKQKRLKCPKCTSINVVKNGTKNKTQRYKCKTCNKYFSITTNSFLSYSKLNYTQMKKMLECMARFETLEVTSKEVGISERETYNIRIKIISIFNKLDKDIKLSGVVQADEKYIRLSFKGTRSEKMPRKSRKNGNGYFQNRGSGISKSEHVCVVAAIDSLDHIILKVAGMGNASTSMIEKALGGKIEEGSILITDSKNSYIKFAKNNILNLKQIPSDKHKIEDYHLGELNSLLGEIDTLILNFKGISTRHLQSYLDWFRYRKVLKYTVEYLNTTNEIYKFILKEDSHLINDQVCKVAMPIDVSEIEFK